jgi:hypothetical protein
MTIAVSEESGSFPSLVEAAAGVEEAVEDAIFPPINRPPT